MSNQFAKHYTPDEARILLPRVRKWLERLATLRDVLAAEDAHISELRSHGQDLGGEAVNAAARLLTELQSILLEFYRRDIQIKDLDRGLVDFPAFLKGKEVFLCWEKSEDDIEYWHDIDAGYAGREPLEGTDFED